MSNKLLKYMTHENLNSFIAAILITSEMIITPIMILFNLTTGANAIVFAIELIIIFLDFLFNYKLFKINILNLFTFFFFVIMIIVSKFINNINYSVYQILFYFVIPFLVGTQSINVEKTLKFSIYLSLTSILCISNLFDIKYEYLNQISMGRSYAIMSCVLAAVFHFLFYRKNANIIIWIGYLLNAYYLYKLFFLSTRGVVFSILIAFLFILFFYLKFSIKNENKEIKFKLRKKTISDQIALFIIIIAVFVIVLNLNNIISTMYYLSKNIFGSAPSFLLKSNFFISNDVGLNNGRNDVYSVALDLIYKKPILGYGIESFSIFSPYPWPHNIFLQFIFELGIFGLIPCFVVVHIIIVGLASRKFDISKLLFLNFLILITFPRYMVSNDIWKGIQVWILISYFISNFSFIKLKNNFY